MRSKPLRSALFGLVAISSVISIDFTRPEVHDWIQQNIYICDLDPTFGRTRFLTREEAQIFRCQCGDPSRTGLACAQHLEQRPFCSRLPSTCLDEWKIQFGSVQSPFPTLTPSFFTHLPRTTTPNFLQPFHDDEQRLQQLQQPRASSFRGGVSEFAIPPPLPPRDSNRRPAARPTTRRPAPMTTTRTTTERTTTSTTTRRPTTTTTLPVTTAQTTTRPPPMVVNDAPPAVGRSIIFETFPSLAHLRLSSEEREQRKKSDEEKWLIERREEKETTGFTKVLSTASAVKINPSLPLPDFAAELSPKQIVDALNNGGFSNTKKRVELMVEDRLLRLFEEEKLLNSVLIKEMTNIVGKSSEDENKESQSDPIGLVAPTSLTEEDMSALKEKEEEKGEEENRIDVIETTITTPSNSNDSSEVMERGAVISEPVELRQGFNETVSIGEKSGEDAEEKLDEATARNVANIMARLLREIIGTKKEIGSPSSPPAGPPSPPPATTPVPPSTLQPVTVSSGMTTDTEPPMAGERIPDSRSPGRFSSQELQNAQTSSEEERSTTRDDLSITVTSVPLTVETTPPTEIEVNITSRPRTTTETPQTTTTVISTTTVARSETTTVPTTTPQAARQHDDTAKTFGKSLFTTREFNPKVCEDNHSLCNVWSKYGECVKNPGYMYKYCRQSCGICSTRRKWH